MISWSFVVLVALHLTAGALTAWRAVPTAGNGEPPIDWGALPTASITFDSSHRSLLIELPPVDLPGGSDVMLEPPTAAGTFPVGGAIYGFSTDAIDADGRVLPGALIHHFNVMDPADRELFLPISRRLLASGGQTGVVRLPWLLLGARMYAGERVLVNTMLHNPTDVSYRGVRVRMVVDYVPDSRPWPFLKAYPWQLDVAFPVGDKSFDLAPGTSERAYEGSPALPGDLLVIGGHLHEYGELIEMSDATTGKVIWSAVPLGGKPDSLPIGRLYGLTHRGVHITPDHRYRVRVVYRNPTGRTVTMGGMGVVAGLFIPDRGMVWPPADPADSLYLKDLRHFLGGSMTKPSMPHMH